MKKDNNPLVDDIMLKYYAILEEQVYKPAMEELSRVEEQAIQKFVQAGKMTESRDIETEARNFARQIRYIDGVKQRMTSRLSSISTTIRRLD